MWRFEGDCDEVVDRLSEVLEKEDLQVNRSFDLQSARQSLAQPHECTCPYHGMAQCACQYVILLVRRSEAEPHTLVVHGSDGRTILTLDQSSQSAMRNDTSEKIRSVIERMNPA